MRFSMSDAAGLFRLIAALYPRDKEFANADKQTIGVWHAMLLDIPADVLSDVAKRHAACNKFPPSIAELREGAVRLVQPELCITSGEAWGMVVDTLRKGVNRQTLDALPACVRTAVKNVGGWYMIARSETPDTIRAQFMRVYEQLVSKQMQDLQQAPRTALAAPARGELIG